MIENYDSLKNDFNTIRIVMHFFFRKIILIYSLQILNLLLKRFCFILFLTVRGLFKFKMKLFFLWAIS